MWCSLLSSLVTGVLPISAFTYSYICIFNNLPSQTPLRVSVNSWAAAGNRMHAETEL